MTDGITTGSRLERLIRLRDRIDLEIRSERAHLLGGDLRPGETRRFKALPIIDERVRTNPGGDLCNDLGVNVPDVRAWALSVGLTTAHSGRITVDVVTAYAHAHGLEVPR